MLTILVGLPGSGKSTWADHRAEAIGDAWVYKDFLGDRRRVADLPTDPARRLFDLLDEVRAGRTVFADDASLCRPHRRIMTEALLGPFLRPGYEVRWLFFANDPATCRRNVELRHRRRPDADRRRESLHWIDHLTGPYAIPGDAVILPVIDHGA